MEGGAAWAGEGAAGIVILLGKTLTELRPPVAPGPVLEDTLGSLLVLKLLWPEGPLSVLGRGAVGRQELPVPGLDVGGLRPAGLHVHSDLLLEILQPEDGTERGVNWCQDIYSEFNFTMPPP